MNTIKNGVYVLTKTITNPKPDRRERYDWRAKTEWEAGTLFEIADWSIDGIEETLECKRFGPIDPDGRMTARPFILYPPRSADQPPRKRQVGGLRDDAQEQGALDILLALEPASNFQAFKHALREHHASHYTEEILFALVRSNAVSQDVIMTIAKEIGDHASEMTAEEWEKKWQP